MSTVKKLERCPHFSFRGTFSSDDIFIVKLERCPRLSNIAIRKLEASKDAENIVKKLYYVHLKPKNMFRTYEANIYVILSKK
jgi:hypothetical protein